ncbi:MAG: hypothetical protein VYA97_07645 [Pseudomonadota bacterium]|nr:hypothetical protein [Pseudomonadota bacterium]
MKSFFRTILASAAILSLVSGAKALPLLDEEAGRNPASLIPTTALSWIAAQVYALGFDFDTPTTVAICKLSSFRCFDGAEGVVTAQVGSFGVLDGFSSGDGGVYLFDTSTTAILLRLLSDEAEADPGVGTSVAVADDTVAVGGTGTVYVFDGTTGSSLGKLTDPDSTDGFGYSVAINGKTIAVGAPDPAAGDGLAYLFDSETGDLLQRLTAPPGASDFGSDVIFDDDVVAVLGNSAGEGETPNPTAYLFDTDTGSFLGAVGGGQSGNPFTSGSGGGQSIVTAGNSLAQTMPPAVPLPAPLWLLLAAFGGTAIARRKAIL